jgi:hypothetical protein
MTMQHAEFRRLFGADPGRTEPEVLAHRAQCAECARYAVDLERVDTLVSCALQVPAPSGHRQPWELERPAARTHRRWYALAAGTIIVLALATGSWLHLRRDELFTELIQHAHKESNVMVPTGKRADDEKVRTALAKAGARLQRSLAVSTVRTCKVRGVVAPHLFVQTPEGPVQFLLLTEHRFLVSHSTRKDGYHAELVPVGNHSVAVIGGSDAAVTTGARLASAAFEWSP